MSSDGVKSEAAAAAAAAAAAGGSIKVEGDHKGVKEELKDMKIKSEKKEDAMDVDSGVKGEGVKGEGVKNEGGATIKSESGAVKGETEEERVKRELKKEGIKGEDALLAAMKGEVKGEGVKGEGVKGEV